MISVNDFAMLQPGDIIRLDRKVEDELDIYVGNIRKFTALPDHRGINMLTGHFGDRQEQ